jgi:hypothetical protein
MWTLTTSVAVAITLSGSVAARQLPTDGIPIVLASAVRPLQPPDKPDAWVLQVISRGGFDGRGAGDLTITSDGAVSLSNAATAASPPPDLLQSLRSYIQAAAPSSWTGSRLGICSDCIRTLVVLTRRQTDGLLNTTTAFWDATTRADVVPDVLRIHDLAKALVQQ